MRFGFSNARTECHFICVIFHPHSAVRVSRVCFLDRIREQKAAPLKAQPAFSAIWSLLYENIPLADRAVNAPNGDLTAAKNMAGFIQKNYARKLSLQKIALSGAVGQNTCCKLFANYFGQTPNTYLNRYRLHKSVELLGGSGPVTEIALAAGFGSASYYTEVFRKYFGKSPTELRKSIRP